MVTDVSYCLLHVVIAVWVGHCKKKFGPVQFGVKCGECSVVWVGYYHKKCGGLCLVWCVW